MPRANHGQDLAAAAHPSSLGKQAAIRDLTSAQMALQLRQKLDTSGAAPATAYNPEWDSPRAPRRRQAILRADTRIDEQRTQLDSQPLPAQPSESAHSLTQTDRQPCIKGLYSTGSKRARRPVNGHSAGQGKERGQLVVPQGGGYIIARLLFPPSPPLQRSSLFCGHTQSRDAEAAPAATSKTYPLYASKGFSRRSRHLSRRIIAYVHTTTQSYLTRQTAQQR